MISVRVEKEIKGENKVALGLNFRQLVCVSVCGGLAVGLSLVIGRPITEAVIPDSILAVAAYYIGWKGVSGMKVEYFALKKAKELVYHNQVRTYRTKNRYVTLLNERYQTMRMEDMQDKGKVRILRKEEKRRRKALAKNGRLGVRKVGVGRTGISRAGTESGGRTGSRAGEEGGGRTAIR